MKLAAIDIGTNSVHMIIADADGRGRFEVLEREKAMVKLGAGVFSSREIGARAFSEGLETIRRYVRLADRYGVDEILTAATSATREARNGGAFLDAVVAETGLAPAVISGAEEARLIFLAVRNAIALREENVLVFDIGGGSTEAVVGNARDIVMGKSMMSGVLRLLDMVGHDGPLGSEARAVLEAHIRFVSEGVVSEARRHGFERVIGTSGTIRTLGEAAHLAEGGKPLRNVNAETVSLNSLRELTERLVAAPPDKRSAIPGIPARRNDAIHLGGVLLVRLLELAGVETLTLCDASLREGLILDYLERTVPGAEIRSAAGDLRHRSMAHLARRYDVDWNRNRHVAGIALALFDESARFHGLGLAERELLEFATLIHDVGQYVGFMGYHHHSRYLIEHAGLRGLTDDEVLLIALIARYHRGERPRKRHKELIDLTKGQRRTVAVLSGLLRLAVALDKTKNQVVESVTAAADSEKVHFLLAGRGDMELELWAAAANRAPLEKALKRPVVISTGGP